MYYLGIDIGSLSCDAVIVDDAGTVLSTAVFPTGAQNHVAIERATAEVVKNAGISRADLKGTISTGYGRERVDTRLASVTEITCHARGIHALFPDVRLLVDIGGQDSKAILLGKEGKVSDFAMNDKCAAGTGRFLEAMARALQVDITELGELDHGAVKNITLSSMCTVFAESEVVSLIANGMPVNEIVRGLNRSIATRTKSLVKRVSQDLNGFKIAMSGGVARNGGVIRALSDMMDSKIHIPEIPDTVGALGAALIARERS
ncbi:MAG: 2-hydroxyglutaryl-CoA dehydratase [Proteobacteria bacterium]|nr:2-hydroxyglutaryl-CoA dehydratase [Pseudomonadota bacterium]